MEVVYNTKFLLRRGTAESWEYNNPVLAYGEPGYDITNYGLKIGDGNTHWKDLDFLSASKEQIEEAINKYFKENPGAGSGATPGKDGISATHRWEGTTLIITSASGTSSANLKGDKGDPGKTPQKYVDYWTEGDKQEIISEIPIPDLDGYATEEYVDKQIANAQLGSGSGSGSVDLSSYYTKSETNEAIQDAIEKIELTPGPKGDTPQKYIDYFTEEDVSEIVERVVDNIPEADVDLEGYATEQWVSDKYQVKGNYLTEVPEEYAKSSEIPTKPEDIGAQPAGEYLTSIPDGYATQDYVKNKIAEASLSGGEVDLSGYATKEELPTKISQLENDKNYLTSYNETDPTVPDWAKASTKPVYTKAEIGLDKVDNIKQYSADNPPPYPVISVNGKTGEVILDADTIGARPSTWMPNASDVGALPINTVIPTKTSQLNNDSGFLTEHIDVSGKLDASKLPEAIDTALAQAKASGDFDGQPGINGKSAYEYAQDGGFKGTEEDFIQKLTTEYLPNTGGDMTGELKMNGQPISGLNNPTANDQAANMGFVNQQVKKAAPQNLLDNSDFRNPVNQRGSKTYDSSGYGIDRWAASGSDSSVTVSDGYVVFSSTSDSNQTVRQFIPDEINLYGKTVTLACETTSGTVYYATGVVPDNKPASTVYRCVCNIGSAQVRLCISATTHNAVQIYTPNYTIRLRWIALYEGEYTSETLPKYQPKGYAEELRICRRFFRSLKFGGYFGTAFTPGADAVQILYDLAEPMRKSPNLQVQNGTVRLYKDGKQFGDNMVPSSFSVQANSTQGRFVIIGVTTDIAPVLTTYSAYAYNLKIWLTADYGEVEE